MTPYELRALADLRRQGRAPELAVFVTDDWPWAKRLGDEVGVLAIRVCNARDHAHDWSPLAGLWTLVALRRPASAELTDFCSAILRANPWRLTTFDGERSALVWQAP